MLKISKLEKSYGDLKVLSGLDMELDRGEILCIQGRSGEGKTTLLRLINGLENKDGGTIDTQGSVGMVFQDHRLFPHLTVWDNLMLAPKILFGKIEKETEAKGLKLLESLEITNLKNYYPYQLSGGQSQRVAVARACMGDPTVLCFDEPTASLDQETIESMISMIDSLAKDGMAILIITHDYEFANAIGHKIMKLKDGVLIN
ncbi:MAG: amino acid ABC transporter ATP-binding protein [Tissierellia bacterium]|nr:amino acid ABC transporter ATP-binding protein [Tissierellia bacterium]